MTRAPRLVALDDQVAALLRDAGPGGLTTTQVWHTLWGPCRGWPHGGCHHDVSYSQAHGSLRRFEATGTVRAVRAGRPSATLWVWSPGPVTVPG